MSATVLISGRIFRAPAAKTSRAGKKFVQATVKEGAGDDVTWWTALCFSASASEELLELCDGDAISVSGSFQAEPFEKDGKLRVRHTIFVDRLISARPVKRTRKVERAPERRQERSDDDGDGANTGAPFVDDIPF